MEFDLSTPVRAILALILVVGLIGLVVWLVRRFNSDRLGSASARGRQPRLAVIDAATVDGRRRLVLIRRDNVEHLLMIGGPTDVVVELNIVRAGAPAREPQPVRPPPAADPLPRPVPLGEGTMWPLQPEPVPRPEPAARTEPAPRPEPTPRPPRASTPTVEEPVQWSEPEASPPATPRERRARATDPLAGLAEELARAPAPSEPAPAEPPPLRSAARREPRLPRPAPAPPPASVESEPVASADQNLAQMAQRLEAALRRPPKSEDARGAVPAAVRGEPAAAASDEQAPEPRTPSPPEPVRATRGEPRSGRAAAQEAPQKSLYDSLEQEMASLLGRPAGKS
jgi:hypothetical protein